MRHTHIKNIVLLGASVLALSACETTSSVSNAELDRTAKINNVLERAARDASRGGHTEQSLGIMENRYKRNSNDPAIATEYAKALREMDYLNRASIVLSPFARDADGSLEAKNEFSAIQLALGNYVVAEDFAKQVIMADEQNAQAFQYLGVALDAQGMHEEAERAYRKGLDTWQGDPTSIMNNLALNLATQGFIDESVEILEKAQSIAPDRMEIERNLRIVRALQETAPSTHKKRRETSINVVPKKKPVRDT